MGKEEEIMSAYRELFEKMSWLNKIEMKKELKGYKASEIHCLEFIGKHHNPNVTQLADYFYMTRGAMSKMTKKLMDKELIESYQNPANKKEIYFKMTSQGQKLFDKHEKLHQDFQKRDQDVFNQVSEEQYKTMLDFANLYGKHLDQEIDKIKK